MPKQYDRALLEVQAKRRLEHTRDQLNLPSLSATIDYLIDNLPADKWKPQLGAANAVGQIQDTHH
jgi:hypothetical protein